MKKIFVISNTTFSIEKFRLHYLSKLKNYEFEIYTPNKIVNSKTKFKNINFKKFNSKNLFDDLSNIYKIIKKNRSKILLVYSFKYQFITSLIKIILFKKFKIISIIAGKGSLSIGGLGQRLLFLIISKFIMMASNVIICINPFDQKYFNARTTKKIDMIPTEGISFSSYFKIKNNQKKFIFFSRLINEKGIYDYIELAKKVKKKYPKLKFYVCGSFKKEVVGQSIFNTNKTIKKYLNINKKFVKYLGYRKNYIDIFKKMDCLISPSLTEGAGTSVMEAMMSGLFVIGYKNSGHKYVISGTKNIICNTNDVNSLEKSLEDYLNLSSKKLKVIANNSREKIIKNFLTKNVCLKFHNIMNNHIG